MELIHTLLGHLMPVLALAYSPDGKFIASGSGDKTIIIWSAGSGKIVHTLSGHAEWVGAVAFSPDGRSIASCSKDHTLKVWDTRDGKLVRTFAYAGELSSVTFCRKYLAVCSYDGSVLIIDRSTFTVVYKLQAHSDWVIALVCSPDGKYLASGSGDKTIKVWKLN